MYEGRSFRAERFERLLAHHSIAWPRTITGRLRLDDETFKEMGRNLGPSLPFAEYGMSWPNSASLAWRLGPMAAPA